MTSESMLLAVDFGAWTSEDWSAASAVATALLTLFTVAIALAAALYARQQVTLARQLREEQAQPFVVVDIQDNPVWRQAFDFVIENMGQTLAKNVKIKIDPPLTSTLDSDGYPLQSTPLLTQGIPSLPPRKRITALFDVGADRREAGLPMKYTATVEFEDAHGRPQEPLTYILDLSIRYSLLSMTEYGVHDAAKALREMSKTLKETRRDLNQERQRQRAIQRAIDELGSTEPTGTE
ncbi:hypothetical protein [Streptomyces sp. V3I7]|uniref:hypothetical protein n=1 Tax=Streptomyces sp. V3I7 TaxID=3042278 RepID=UPI00277EEE74|nr:hypothetical protein [Streptomyces sp. V3I7]MDQ0993041.1 hypothetical protein [Streptomyces sp. V3I7]